MAIPEEIRAAAEVSLSEFCQRHSSEAVADQLRYEYAFDANSALLIEKRPSFLNPADWTAMPRAKFRYSASKGVWTLYWGDNNEKWHRVSSAPASPNIESLLQQVIADPSGVFWG